MNNRKIALILEALANLISHPHDPIVKPEALSTISLLCTLMEDETDV